MSLEKRKHSALSSISDLDTSESANNSSILSKTNEQKNSKTKSKNKKKAKKAKIEENEETEQKEKKQQIINSEKMSNKSSVEEELQKINKRLDQVITKDDNSFLRQIVKDVFLEIKETLLSSFTRQIEVIEGELHEKAVENDRLKSEMKNMKKELDQKADELKRLEKKNEYDRLKYNETLNDQEQYSRRNNIRISNLPGDSEHQSSEETSSQVVDFVQRKLGVNLSKSDIDISHRLGKFSPSRPRQIIVKLVRRQTKADILAERKKLKGSNTFVFEDLTKLNNEILACTRKKQADEVDRSWSVDGKIFVKWKSDSSIEKLKFADFQKWIDLPWPTTAYSRRG